MVMIIASECPKCGENKLFWNKCEACGTVFELTDIYDEGDNK